MKLLILNILKEQRKLSEYGFLFGENELLAFLNQGDLYSAYELCQNEVYIKWNIDYYGRKPAEKKELTRKFLSVIAQNTDTNVTMNVIVFFFIFILLAIFFKSMDAHNMNRDI